MAVSKAVLMQRPNMLTLGRVAAVPFFVAAFWLPAPAAYWVTFTIFVLASATDWLDGWLARRRNLVSDFGRFLDPIADKILVAAALVMLVATGRLSEVSVVAVVLILVRELVVSGLREFLAGDVVVPVTKLAKWKTAVQMMAIAVLLVAGAFSEDLHLFGEVMLWLAAVLTLITGAAYLKAGFQHMDS